VPGDLPELVLVVDEGPATPHHDAPAALELVVELVDLEAQLRATAVGAEQAVGGGADEDRVPVHGVVHRHDVRSRRGPDRDPARDAGVEQAGAVLPGEVVGGVHGILLQLVSQPALRSSAISRAEGPSRQGPESRDRRGRRTSSALDVDGPV
jgi:hypothetical protein